MKIHVAYDQDGRILAAAESGPKGAGDRPVGGIGVNVAELEVPTELANTSFGEHVHRLHVDVATKKLVVRREAK